MNESDLKKIQDETRAWNQLSTAEKIEYAERKVLMYGECLESDKWKQIIERMKNGS